MCTIMMNRVYLTDICSTLKEVFMKLLPNYLIFSPVHTDN